MAILYGTTGDGTTLPVLVDQFGNLLAKGIEGQPGTPGEPGPPGPPGIGQLPEDPFEGAILGWEDGELSWLGGSVPLPAGTYGPFVYSDFEATLTVPQDVSSLINGQQIYQSSADGVAETALIETDDIVNVKNDPSGSIVLTFPEGATNFENIGVGDEVQMQLTLPTNDWANLVVPAGALSAPGFDGSINTTWSGNVSANAYNTFTPTNGIPFVDKVEWYNGGVSGAAYKYNDGPRVDVGTNQWITVATGGGLFKSLGVTRAVDDVHGWYAIRVDGQILLQGSPSNTPITITAIDADESGSPSVPTITVNGGSWYAAPPTGDGSGLPGGETKISISKEGSGSVLTATGNTIVMRNNNRQWIDGFYVTAPEQRIAARKAASSAIRRKKN